MTGLEGDQAVFGGPCIRPNSRCHCVAHGQFSGRCNTNFRGRGAAGKTLAAGALEILPGGWGRARLAVIPDATAATLKAFVQANVVSGSTIIADKQLKQGTRNWSRQTPPW